MSNQVNLIKEDNMSNLSNENYGLKSITYFNTGRFDYAYVEVDGNTLLTGTNGSGKTTTIESVLFFYSGKSEKIKPKAEGKKTWENYMYPYENSYIFYRYTGIGGVDEDTLLMTYRNGDKIVKVFIPVRKDFTNEDLKSIVLKEDKKVKKPGEILDTLLLDYRIKPIAKIIDEKEYRRILYGEEYRYYNCALMKGKPDVIINALFSILSNSKISSTAFKETIVSVYGEKFINEKGEKKNVINIQDIKNQIREVRKKYEVWEAFTGDKVDKMESYLKQYKEQTKEIELRLSQLMIIKDDFEEIIKKNNSKIALKEKERNEKEDFYKGQIEDIEKQTREVIEKLSVTGKELENAIELSRKHEKENIEFKILEVKKIPELEKQLELKKIEYESSSKSIESISKELDKLKTEREKVYYEELNKYREEYEKKIEEYRKEIKEKERERDEELAKVEDSLIKEEENLRELLTKTSIKYNEIKNKKDDIEKYNPYLSELDELKKNISNIEVEVKLLNTDLRQKEWEIKELDRKKKEYEWKITNIKFDTNKKIEKQTEPFRNENETLKAKLEASDNTVLGIIRNKLPQEAGDILITLLKDEILLSEDINPSVVEIHNSAYGLAFDINRLPKVDITTESILKKIQVNEKRIKDIEETITKNANVQIDEINERIGEISKKIVELEKEKSRISDEIANNEAKFKLLQDNFKSKEKEINERWAKERKDIQDEYEKVKKEFEKIDKQLRDFHNRKKEIINSVKGKYQEEINRLENLIKSEKVRLEEEEKRLKEEKDKFIKEIEEQRERALKESGISIERINQIKQEIDKLEEKIKNAKGYEKYIGLWESEKEKINKIPFYKQEIEKLNGEEKLLKEKKRELEEEKEKVLKEMLIHISELREENKVYENYINNINRILSSYEYEEFIENAKKQKDEIKKFYKSNESNINNNIKKVDELIEEIVKTKGKRKENITDAARFIQEFHSKIPHKEELESLKFDISTVEKTIESIESHISFAKDGKLDKIREFIIEYVKQMTEHIKGTVEKINDEMDIFESNIRRISGKLKQSIEKIPVLQDINVELKRNEHQVFSILKQISELQIFDDSPLFSNSTESKKARDKIFELFENLLKEIDELKSLTIDDFFDLEFMVNENGNKVVWRTLRGDIGSTGTFIIVATLFYLALLISIMEKTQKNSKKKVPIHVMLDEVGMIEENNMRQIINFANENGLIFLNAAPNLRIMDMYDKVYSYKITGKKTILSEYKILGKDVSDVKIFSIKKQGVEK